MKIAVAALLVCALGGAAAASAAKPKPKPKAKPQPVFRVTIKSTYSDHHVITLVEPIDVNTGCHQRYDVDATQTIDVSTTTPVVRTLAQIKSGAFPPMQAHEQRNGSGRDGWEPGCAALKDDPAQLDDTSACGAQSYTISKPSFGFLATTGTRFAFTYSRNAADPYDGNCFAGIYLDPNSDALNSVVSFPPDPWGTAAGTKPFWADLDRSRLTSGKTITLSWSDTATVSQPFVDEDPTLVANVESDVYTLSWQATLVPVKPAKKK